LARDPVPTAAALADPARAGLSPQLGGNGRDSLARPSGPDPGSNSAPARLLVDPASAGPARPRLLAGRAEPVTRPSMAPPGFAVPGLAGGAPPADGSAAALRDGLARGEIGVHYQPVVRLADRRPVMVEALARWHTPDTSVSPDTFVPLAESTGLGRSLSVSVAGTAAVDIARLWPRLRLGVSINLPLAQLLQPDLQSWLRRALGRRGLGPRQVALELTETTPVLDVTQLHRTLLRLKQAGYRVLLDDVALGDGRTRLHRLPFSGLKLDRSLVERLPFEAHGRQAVRRLVRAAEARGQAVIAEGVSDRRIWGALCDLGVHYAQGYAVGRPLPATALPGWWAGWRGGRVE
jgi:EAL domain-containing protein (putative c-di-GMP-specific phosphodiesterase class I)